MKVPTRVIPTLATLFALVSAVPFCIPVAAPAEEGEGSEDKPTETSSAGELKAGELTFRFAAPWAAKKEPRAMSIGGLVFTPEGDGLEAVDADFYHFGAGQGGGVEPNIRRWQGQFVPQDGEAPKVEREELTFGDRKVTIIRIKGSFLDGPMFGTKTEKPGHALLGAIVPNAEEGDVFIKMTGPEKSIDAAGEPFRKLVASAFADE